MRILALSLVLIVLSLAPIAAHAACSSPAGAEGAVDYSTTSRIYRVCNSADQWVPFVSSQNPQISGTFVVSTSAQTTTPSIYVDTTGNVGMGTSNPNARLDVAGLVSATYVSSSYVQVSSASTVLACGTALKGTLRFISSTIEVCNGTSWLNASPVKAYARINGSDGSILSSYNVSSVTRNSAGVYTITLANAMPNASYGVTANAQTDNTNVNYDIMESWPNDFTRTTTQFRLRVLAFNGYAAGDPATFSVEVTSY